MEEKISTYAFSVQPIIQTTVDLHLEKVDLERQSFENVVQITLKDGEA